jgi:hypothetical protein
MGKPRQSGDGRSLAGTNDPSMPPRRDAGELIRDATNKIKFGLICMATAALIGAVMTRIFTSENPKEPADYIFPRVGRVNPDGSPRRLTTILSARNSDVPEARPGAWRRHRWRAGWRQGHVLSKMLFGPSSL